MGFIFGESMELIGTDKAARILDMHPVTLREMANKEEIPAYKIGRKWKFDVEELEKFLKKDKDHPEQEAGHKENICHVKSSPSRKEGKSGITRSRRQMVSAYAEALGLQTKIKRSN
ncbi:helix-turn-helix domain-containing protein [Aggregatibacter actinomycetemcomitans]|uniref:DNA-binding protein n=1 Tax=Aggregatibacter actinomycetemcomitans TaxID=714 RepID=A0A2G1DRC3_AGGAC|nr:helix-turn-helix domain-containing protein [Aggregatibacter actinomycetemcomitans]PHO20846.1 DNA-binding protein [Aggregatibacter actinomycetemcomitans]PHO22993.1 DNA-binding protein [Aggregatibacter actinomycetemcomitans]QEH44919.1 helix-turn-helix domain-containing protein [Aggregatibacter actinomycetemcomitans]QEH46982.1 helix-turn-helix domain-containing protein [Aggregatibacter actinomycetemcomitans]QEH49934.1 helix-turn-helix domain-containing protein [Aggregatibacter actinomycetemcom